MSVWACVTDSTFSVQERKFEGGSSQISECMARELGERVKLESPVYSIDQTGDTVLVKTLDNQTYSVCFSSWFWDIVGLHGPAPLQL